MQAARTHGGWDSKILMPAGGEGWQKASPGALRPLEVQSLSLYAAEAWLVQTTYTLYVRCTCALYVRLRSVFCRGPEGKPRAGSGITLVLDDTDHKDPSI